ncbi:hypothetical protein FHS89_001554 [Rubricella aquisinus]|uniref:HAD family hydrolase n=1 Tax=Rubricella aquisinus TaxID=2028108 RepID=A0A840WPH3_9RHOB|nr:hypothetical protein [Rubricella aquisinus]MBB5515542.1 hypothetical protein [Rubricella aquisinus]
MLNDQIRPQLETLSLEPGKPLLVVDADEVLVYFLRDFRHYVGAQGWDLRLTEYSLEAALHHRSQGHVGDRATALALIDAYFQERTAGMEAITGAARALSHLSDQAQIVVLTNLPHHAKSMREQNLRAHGIPYPVLTNHGGKGPVLHHLAERVGAPVAFVDDSPSQVRSARKHAPTVATHHFVGCDEARAVIPAPEDTPYLAETWEALVPHLEVALS